MPVGTIARSYPAPARPAAPVPRGPQSVAAEVIRVAAARYGWQLAGLSGWSACEDQTGETAEMRRDYPKMMADDAAKAATESLLADISSQDFQVTARDDNDPVAVRTAEFVNNVTLEQQGGVPAMVEAALLGALVEKHSLSQIVMRDRRESAGKWAGKNMVRTLKPKSPGSYRVKKDSFNNVTGFEPVDKLPDEPEVYAPEGFVYYANSTLYADPEGNSEFRAAYRFWKAKDRIFKLWAVYTELLNGGFIEGSVENAADADRFLAILEKSRGAGIVVTERGWQVKVHDLEQGSGAVHERFEAFCNQGIFRSIRGAHLQQLEGQVSDGRGSAQVAAKESTKPTWRHLVKVSAALTDQFNTYVVGYNFAPGTPVPVTTLGSLDPAETMAQLEIADMVLNRLRRPISSKAVGRVSGWAILKPDDPDAVNPPPLAPVQAPGQGADPALSGVFAEPGGGGGDGARRRALPPKAVAPAGRGDTTLAGPDGRRVARLLRESVADGAGRLHSVSRRAVGRLLASGGRRPARLFTEAERAELADALAATGGTANLLGRYGVRERYDAAVKRGKTRRFAEGDATPARPAKPGRRTPFAAFAEQPPRPLAPEDALAFFLALIPTLSAAADPQRFAESQRTRAAQLAGHTDGVLLARVLAALADPAVAAGGVDAILDRAGVGAAKSSYGKTVFRERAVAEYVGGLDAERREPEVARVFPGWRYRAKVRPTSRPHHAARNGHVYPVGRTFEEVRGTAPEDIINCLCVPELLTAEQVRRLRGPGRLRRFAEYDPQKHPHRPKGSPEGGEFQPTGGGTESGRGKLQAKAPARRGEMAPARREGKGKDARLVLADGSPAPAHVAAGKIPPQWSDVQVSLDPGADVLATGRDAAGRAKVIYRDEFHERNAAHKFARTKAGLEQAAALHAENQRNRSDPKLREEADSTWLMQEQATRPGSDKDTAAKVKAFGATTLLAEHVVEAADGVRLQFVGKEGVHHDHLISNPELAKMLLGRKQSAGGRGGRLFDTNYAKVAAYAKSLDSGRFTPKDFRTIRANQLAVDAIGSTPPPNNLKGYKAAVKAVAERVSGVLGNRPAQALESYIDPSVFAQWRAVAHA